MRTGAKGVIVMELDLGLATDWDEGETHNRVKLVKNRHYDQEAKKDVLMTSPVSIELRVNTIFQESRESAKFFFTALDGGRKVVVAVLDSDGNLYLRGSLTEFSESLSYK
jgi:hypothetical protein